MKASVIIEKDNFGYYAFCPALKGCHTQGNSLDEILINIREAVELYLETITKEEAEYDFSKEIFTTTLEVDVA